MPGANTLAYLSGASVTKKKKFYNIESSFQTKLPVPESRPQMPPEVWNCLGQKRRCRPRSGDILIKLTFLRRLHSGRKSRTV